jgi:hypothetical protein
MYDDQGAMCPFKEHKYISDGDWQPPSDTEKGDWCPLRPLPEKHGRLIDADAMKRIWMGARIDGDIWMLLDARPTIVEAEGY